MATVEETKLLIEQYNECFAQRKACFNSRERIQLTQKLNDLERQIRLVVKTHPVPEPLGMKKLEEIARQMTAKGYTFLAVRITGQQYRSPMAIPFRDLEHLREYIGVHLDENLAGILEVKPRKKLFGIFGKS